MIDGYDRFVRRVCEYSVPGEAPPLIRGKVLITETPRFSPAQPNLHLCATHGKEHARYSAYPSTLLRLYPNRPGVIQYHKTQIKTGALS